MDEDKASMYIVAIVGVVAAVGIFVLLMGNSGTDLSGQAIGIGGTSQLKSGVSGLVETSTGQQVSGIAGADSASDSCSDGKVYCEYCRSKSSACAAGCTQYC